MPALAASVPDLMDQFYIFAYNPDAREATDGRLPENAAKKLHMRKVAEHYGYEYGYANKYCVPAEASFCHACCACPQRAGLVASSCPIAMVTKRRLSCTYMGTHPAQRRYEEHIAA